MRPIDTLREKIDLWKKSTTDTALISVLSEVLKQVDMAICEMDHQDAASPWHRVEDELPKESNCYIVYLRQGTEMETPDWMGGEPLSYVTEMGFNKEQMLWQNGDDAYNAILSAVDTKKDFHITHWMEKPEPPKEIMNE